jgi:hypothetical protein
MRYRNNGSFEPFASRTITRRADDGRALVEAGDPTLRFAATFADECNDDGIRDATIDE